MKDQIKISVITPVYNGEADIEQCIHSALAQELKELEIICVDDGSTDGSAKIIKRLASTDSRIVLIQQKNQGPGAARNLALKKARGKYVTFLDADDYYLDKDALKKMYEACEREKTGVSVSLWWRVNGSLVKRGPFSWNEIGKTTISYLDYQMDYDYMCYLFLRELLVEHEIWFPLYYRFQDPPFLVKALYAAKNISVVDTCLYSYHLPQMKKRFNKKKTVDLLRGLLDNLEFAKRNDLNILLKNTARRLEYEYAEILCKNRSYDDSEWLELLMKANEIIQQELKHENYVIRPLRLLLFPQQEYETYLLEEMEKQPKAALYGAGRLGSAFVDFIERNGLKNKIGNFLVSQLEEKDLQVKGIPVISLKEFCPEKESRIFVTVGEEYQKEMEDHLNQMGYKDYVVVREEIVHRLADGV